MKRLKEEKQEVEKVKVPGVTYYNYLKGKEEFDNSKKNLEKQQEEASKNAEEQETGFVALLNKAIKDSGLKLETQLKESLDKFEFDIKDRKELSKVLECLSKANIKANIKRGVKEGYRYLLQVKNLTEAKEFNKEANKKGLRSTKIKEVKPVREESLKESIDLEALEAYANMKEGENITVTADLLNVLEKALEMAKQYGDKKEVKEGCKKALKETWAGEDVIDDLIERAQMMYDDGNYGDLDECVNQAIDEGLIYTKDIYSLLEHYGSISDSEIIESFFDDLWSDVYNGVEEHEEEDEDEDDEDIDESKKQECKNKVLEALKNRTFKKGLKESKKLREGKEHTFRFSLGLDVWALVDVEAENYDEAVEKVKALSEEELVQGDDTMIKSASIVGDFDLDWEEPVDDDDFDESLNEGKKVTFVVTQLGNDEGTFNDVDKAIEFAKGKNYQQVEKRFADSDDYEVVWSNDEYDESLKEDKDVEVVKKEETVVEEQQLNEIFPDRLVALAEKAKKENEEAVKEAEEKLEASTSKEDDYAILSVFWNKVLDKIYGEWDEADVEALVDDAESRFMPMPESVHKQFVLNIFGDKIKNLDVLTDIEVYDDFLTTNDLGLNEGDYEALYNDLIENVRFEDEEDKYTDEDDLSWDEENNKPTEKETYFDYDFDDEDEAVEKETVKVEVDDEGVEEIEKVLEKSNTFEFESGDYCYVGYKDGKLFAGSATNSGIMHDVEIDYDKDLSVDENLERLYNAVIEKHPEYLEF